MCRANLEPNAWIRLSCWLLTKRHRRVQERDKDEQDKYALPKQPEDGLTFYALGAYYPHLIYLLIRLGSFTDLRCACDKRCRRANPAANDLNLSGDRSRQNGVFQSHRGAGLNEERNVKRVQFGRRVLLSLSRLRNHRNKTGDLKRRLVLDHSKQRRIQ